MRSGYYDDPKAIILEEMADEAADLQRTESEGAGPVANGHEWRGPTWRDWANIIGAICLGIGAYQLKGMKEQGDAAMLAIVRLETRFEEKVAKADETHADLKAEDAELKQGYKELVEAVQKLNDKLDQERLERIRGER